MVHGQYSTVCVLVMCRFICFLMFFLCARVCGYGVDFEQMVSFVGLLYSFFIFIFVFSPSIATSGDMVGLLGMLPRCYHIYT